MANIETNDVEIMVHADESTIPADVDKPTIHLIKADRINTLRSQLQ